METVCSSANGAARCQVRNISRWCCWFQARFYLLWAGNYTTQAVCGARKHLILQPPGGTWRSPKTIVPKIHMPTLPLPLWQTYHALLLMAFTASWNRAEENTGSVCLRAARSLNAAALPFYAILYQNNECRHILSHLDNACSLKNTPSLSVLAPKWDKTCSVNQLVHHRALI